MSRPLRVGTRGSELALWQARRVAALLAERGYPETELVVVHTAGDRDKSRALHELPGSGFFTRELQRALLDDEVDLVVHSLKDLPIDEPEGLALAAVCEREDVRDLLLSLPGAHGDGPLGLRPGARLGTSSLRRAAQVLAIRPDITIGALRGNVPSRLRRLRDGEYDAIMLAAAGVGRLEPDLSDLVSTALPLETVLPAPGQGALAVEIRANDIRALGATAPLNDAGTAEATGCERALLGLLGGGCHLPLGAHATRDDGVWHLAAALGELDEAVTTASVTRVLVSGPDAGACARAALRALRPTDRT
ncbi:MAG: hydroxymethylbilane synthase [Acidobacteriota bacterium]